MNHAQKLNTRTTDCSLVEDQPPGWRYPGVLTTVTELGDFKFVVTMDDGWMAEVCESELQRVEHEDQPPQ